MTAWLKAPGNQLPLQRESHSRHRAQFASQWDTADGEIKHPSVETGRGPRLNRPSYLTTTQSVKGLS